MPVSPGYPPEPDHKTWLKFCITAIRGDGGIVDAEFLRPRTWIEQQNLVVGSEVPIYIDELQLDGFARVTAIEACPPIAFGDGSVVTARFTTRQVDQTVRVEIRGLDGQSDVIEGTTIHPVWSLDRSDWVPLGDLNQGERLLGQEGVAVVRSVTLYTHKAAVHNLEIHTHHVYQVGNLAILVHNAYDAARRTPNWREFEKLAFGHTPNKETFTLAWTGNSRSWGTRIPDDWVPSTGTIQEATKLNWHEVNLAHPTSQTWKQFTDKLQQATQDGWLLRNDPRVKEVIWYGAEALPTTGRCAELVRLLRENGIIYRVVEIP